MRKTVGRAKIDNGVGRDISGDRIVAYFYIRGVTVCITGVADQDGGREGGCVEDDAGPVNNLTCRFDAFSFEFTADISGIGITKGIENTKPTQ